MEKTPTFPPCERIIGVGANARIGEAIARHMPGGRYLLLCDDATWVACGQTIYLELLKDHKVKPYSLGRAPRAAFDHTEKLRGEMAEMDGIVAVGSGTINDIAKYTASHAGKPYIIVATAASMNGYTSANASLEVHGFKHSFPGAPPRAIVADLGVVATAPRRMARAGLGDTLCRSCVESDMILAHHLFGTPYPREAFDCFRANEEALIAQGTKLKDADTDYIGLLMHALCDGGDWMTKTGSSAIASQGEHMIIHTIELMYGRELRGHLHGELVAVATMTSGALQQKMLIGQPKVKSLPRDEVQFTRPFGKHVGPGLAALYERKVISPEAVDDLQRELDAKWPEIKATIQAIQQPVERIDRLYRQINLPIAPRQIGIDEQRYLSATGYAYLTRERFTFLDLAVMSGKR